MTTENGPVSLRGYLKQGRSRVILASFLGASGLFVAFPEIDLRISAFFFDDGFRLANQWWIRLLHAGLAYAIALAMLAVVSLWIHNRNTGRKVLGVDGRTVSYLVLVLALGAGLIVNVVFKDHIGRARPRDIEEFDGPRRFTPAFVISEQCDRNCSFSSGEAAGGFFALALARALSRRRSATILAVAFGSLVSLARIAGGAHFFSDVVVSFFVMLIATDCLHYALGFSPTGPPTSVP